MFTCDQIEMYKNSFVVIRKKITHWVKTAAALRSFAADGLLVA